MDDKLFAPLLAALFAGYAWAAVEMWGKLRYQVACEATPGCVERLK